MNREIKRVDIFIRAAALVREALSEVEFWIIGDGNQRRNLESLAEGLGMLPHVRFLGRRADVENLLPSIQVGVLSSDSEGLANALLEYMRAGLPVVATDVGGNGEVVENGKTGLLVPPGNAEAMAEAILALLKDPARAAALGDAAKQRFTEKFAVESMLVETEQLYRQLCERRWRPC